MYESQGSKVFARMSRVLLDIIDLPKGWEADDISVAVHLEKDLRMDSLAFADFETALEREFDISLESRVDWRFVQNLMQAHSVVMKAMGLPEIETAQEFKKNNEPPHPEDEIPF